MTGPNDVIQRGYDSSGRPLRMTAIEWQCFDDENDRLGGKLVIVQGGGMAGSGASASAGTHDQWGCKDVRRWNLTTDEAREFIRDGRELGDIVWERTAAQGFDPHFHCVLPIALPMNTLAVAQVYQYRAHTNGLANHGYDPFPYHPNPLPTYRWTAEEDDMAIYDAKLDRIETKLDRSIDQSRTRDKKEAQADRARQQQLLEAIGRSVDRLGLIENAIRDDDSASAKNVRTIVREQKRDLLRRLRDDPDTTGTRDDPSAEAVAEAEKDAG